MQRVHVAVTLAIVVAICTVAARAQTPATQAPQVSQGDANRRVVLRLLEEVWNQGRVELCDELLAPSAVVHFAGRDYPAGPDESKQVVTYWRSALAGFRFQIDDVIAEGDRVVAHVPFQGAQVKPILDIPVTGRTVRLDETLICRVDQGKIVEIWESFDESGLRAQLSSSNEAKQTAGR
jgi:predicted ester cyclase